MCRLGMWRFAPECADTIQAPSKRAAPAVPDHARLSCTCICQGNRLAFSAATRFVRLCQHCPKIHQVGEFGGVPSAIARRFMEPDEIDTFRSAIEGAVRQYIEESETREELFQALVCFRLALSSQVDFGPYENDPGARAETGRRDAAYRDGDFYWVGDFDDFMRLTDTHMARLPQNP